MANKLNTALARHQLSWKQWEALCAMHEKKHGGIHRRGHGGQWSGKRNGELPDIKVGARTVTSLAGRHLTRVTLACLNSDDTPLQSAGLTAYGQETVEDIWKEIGEQ